MNSFIRRLLATGAVAALAGANAMTQFAYLSPVAHQDWAILLDRLHALRHVAPGVAIMLDAPDLAKASLISYFTRGHPAATYAGETCLFSSKLVSTYSPPPLPSAQFKEVDRLSGLVINSYHRLRFQMPPDGTDIHEFSRIDLPGPTVGTILVSTAADESVLNGSLPRPSTGRYFVVPAAEVHDYLVRVDSSLGCTLYPGIAEPVALWQREPDFANAGGGMQAMGRHLLFEVLNPLHASRLLLDFTSTPLAASDLQLPPAQASGENTVELGFIGRGAGRVLSDPIVPRMIGGRSYIALDMNVAPRAFPVNRAGLAGLFNRDLNFDPRKVVGFARNISLISDDQANRMMPPAAIERFPNDLFNPALLFSGVYEDGWMAEAARFSLGMEKEARGIRIKGQSPGLPQGKNALLKIMVDGLPVALRDLPAGDFDLHAAIPAATGRRVIELQVSAEAVDHRGARLLLRSIALEQGN